MNDKLIADLLASLNKIWREREKKVIARTNTWGRIIFFNRQRLQKKERTMEYLQVTRIFQITNCTKITLQSYIQATMKKHWIPQYGITWIPQYGITWMKYSRTTFSLDPVALVLFTTALLDLVWAGVRRLMIRQSLSGLSSSL